MAFFKREYPYFLVDKVRILFQEEESSAKYSAQWVDLLNEISDAFGKSLKISCDWTKLSSSPFDIREMPTECLQLEIVRMRSTNNFKWTDNKKMRYNAV